MTRVGVIRTGVIVVAVGALEVLCRTGVISNFTMIPPSAKTLSPFSKLLT